MPSHFGPRHVGVAMRRVMHDRIERQPCHRVRTRTLAIARLAAIEHPGPGVANGLGRGRRHVGVGDGRDHRWMVARRLSSGRRDRCRDNHALSCGCNLFELHARRRHGGPGPVEDEDDRQQEPQQGGEHGHQLQDTGKQSPGGPTLGNRDPLRGSRGRLIRRSSSPTPRRHPSSPAGTCGYRVRCRRLRRTGHPWPG